MTGGFKPFPPMLLTYTPPKFMIGGLPVHGELILSPMDGYSDQPFRSLCRELGSAVSYSEFINALDVLHGHPRLEERLAYLPEERPVIYQIFDSDPARLVEAALKLSRRAPDAIDLNLGCSDRSVAGRGAGAGMMRDPDLAGRAIGMLRRALDIPVTAKMRLGWDDQQRNYLAVARRLEENGVNLIAVHGRTKAQGYSGAADWDAIAEIKQAVGVPVIANGDVRSVSDIERVLAHTGCDGVMIGRAAIGNPWIFSRLDRDQVSKERVRATMLLHLERSLAFYGERRGLVLFRKHASHYLLPLKFPPEQRRALLTAETPGDFLKILDLLD